MARFTSVLLVFLSCLPAWATMAVVVPSRDGLVIAADSRQTFLGAECDGAFKLLAPRQPGRTVAVVTGDSVFVAPPPAGTSDLCGYLKAAPRLLDVNAVVIEALEQPTARMADVSDACLQALGRFRAQHPDALTSYAGREIFAVVLASYDPARAESTVRRFAVRMNAGGQIEAVAASETRFSAQSASAVLIFGETEWAKRALSGGVGRRILSEATVKFLAVPRPVGAVGLDQALAVARNLMEAASRAAENDPPPSGVGGEVQVGIIGNGFAVEHRSVQ